MCYLHLFVSVSDNVNKGYEIVPANAAGSELIYCEKCCGRHAKSLFFVDLRLLLRLRPQRTEDSDSDSRTSCVIGY